MAIEANSHLINRDEYRMVTKLSAAVPFNHLQRRLNNTNLHFQPSQGKRSSLLQSLISDPAKICIYKQPVSNIPCSLYWAQLDDVVLDTAFLKESTFEESAWLAGLQRYSATPSDMCSEVITESVYQCPKAFILGTHFECHVWQTLTMIPFGQRVSYEWVAKKMQNRGIRAVASAIGRNCLAPIIPCHRVIRKDGALGGYRWGLPVKEHLLEQEMRHSA